MPIKTYTQRGNCARAAKQALGKTAKAGVDFTIGGEKGNFFWTATKKAGNGNGKNGKPKNGAPKKAKRVKGEALLKDQPQMRKILELCGRKTGATIAELAERLGGVEQHTVRGSISRLLTENPGILVKVQSGRNKTYHLAETYEPKEEKTGAE